MPLQETVIPLSKRKLTLLSLLSLAFVAGGCWMTIAHDSMRNPVVSLIIGVITILFFGLCGIFMLRKLQDNRPGLILDAAGITDNSSGVSAGIIRWSDIEQVSILKVQRQKFLMIRVTNPQEYIDRQASSMKRKMMALNYKIYGSPLNISANSLKISFSELQRLVGHYLEASRQNR